MQYVLLPDLREYFDEKKSEQRKNQALPGFGDSANLKLEELRAVTSRSGELLQEYFSSWPDELRPAIGAFLILISGRNATVKEILPDGVIYEKDGAEHKLTGFDTIVLALGVRSYNPLEETVNAMGKQAIVIGDAAKPGPANKATEAALDAVLSIA